MKNLRIVIFLLSMGWCANAHVLSDQVAIVVDSDIITQQALEESIQGYARLTNNTMYQDQQEFRDYVAKMVAMHHLLEDFAKEHQITLTKEEAQNAIESYIDMQAEEAKSLQAVAKALDVEGSWLKDFVLSNALKQKIGMYVIMPTISVDEESIKNMSDLWMSENTAYKIKSWTVDKHTTIDTVKQIKQAWAETGEDPEVGEVNDLGWVKAETLPDLFIAALKGVKPGNLVGPIKSNYGYHLLWFEGEKRPEALDPAIIRQTLFHEKYLEVFNEWLETLLSYHIVVYKA